jgi:hypothetical protein
MTEKKFNNIPRNYIVIKLHTESVSELLGSDSVGDGWYCTDVQAASSGKKYGFLETSQQSLLGDRFKS